MNELIRFKKVRNKKQFLKKLFSENEVTITQYMELLHESVGDDYEDYDPYDFQSFIEVVNQTSLSDLLDVWASLVDQYEEYLEEAMEMSEEEDDEAGYNLAQELDEPVEVVTKTSYYLNSSPIREFEEQEFDDLDEDDEFDQ